MAAAYRSAAFERLLCAIPDTAENVDFRGLLLRRDAWILPDAADAKGWVYGIDAIELVCGWGELTDELVARALASRPSCGLVVPEGTPDLPFLSGRRVGTCVLYRRPDTAPPLAETPLPRGVKLVAWPAVPPGAMDHAPEYLRTEITAAAVRSGVSVTLVEGVPVSFCYAHHESETWWDVSVDTLEDWRRQGHSRRSFLHRARLQAARGKRPAWGAMTDNAASNGMARSLGFVPAGSLRYYFSAAATSRPDAGSGS